MNNDIENIAEAAGYPIGRHYAARAADGDKHLDSIRELGSQANVGAVVANDKGRFQEWLNGKDGTMVQYVLLQPQRGAGVNKDVLYQIWQAGARYGKHE